MASQMKFYLLLMTGFVRYAFSLAEGVKYLPIECPGKNHFTAAAAKPGLKVGEICGLELKVGDVGPDFPSDVARKVIVDLRCGYDTPYTTTQDVAVGADINADLLFNMALGYPVENKAQSHYCLMQITLSTGTGLAEKSLASKHIRVVLYPALNANAYLKITQSIPVVSWPDVVQVDNGQLKMAVLSYTQILFEWSGLGNFEGNVLYSAVFLKTKSKKFVTQSEFNGRVTDKFSSSLPRMDMNDIFINFTTTKATEAQGTESLTNLLPDDLTKVCGEYELIFFVDIMGTVVEEQGFCDNFLRIPVKFNCQENHELHPGVKTAVHNVYDPRQALFVVDGLEDYYNKFNHYKQKDSMENKVEIGVLHDNLKLHGSALLNVLWKDVVNKQSANCEGVDEETAVGQLREIDGLVISQSVYAQTTESKFVVTWNQFSDPSVPEQTLLDVYITLPEVYSSSLTLDENIDNMIKIQVVRTLILTRNPTALPRLPMTDFSIQHMLERLIGNDHSEISDKELVYYAGSLTRILIGLKLALKETTCFEHQYGKLINLMRNIKTSMAVTLTANERDFFSIESIEELALLTGRTEIPKQDVSRLEVNSCFKWVDTYTNTLCEEEPDKGLEQDTFRQICLIKKFHTFMKDNRKALGFYYLMKYLLLAQAKDAEEDGKKLPLLDPMRMTHGVSKSIPFRPGQFRTHTTFKREYNKVCRKKIAICLWMTGSDTSYVP